MRPSTRTAGTTATDTGSRTRTLVPLPARDASLLALAPAAFYGALFHTGIDVGGCRDGSGFYAVADGVVYFAAGIWPSEGIFVYALDARSGEVLGRRLLTVYLTNATYNVYTGDSPTP